MSSEEWIKNRHAQKFFSYKKNLFFFIKEKIFQVCTFAVFERNVLTMCFQIKKKNLLFVEYYCKVIQLHPNCQNYQLLEEMMPDEFGE